MTSAWRREGWGGGVGGVGGGGNLKKCIQISERRSHRTIGGVHKLKHRWFPLNIRRQRVRVTEPWL